MEQEQHAPEQPPPKPTRLEWATAFLKSGTGLLAAVTALVVAVGGLVTAVSGLAGRGDGGDAAGEVAAPAGSSSETVVVLESRAQRELLSHVPAPIRPSCGPPVDPEEGAVAAINCRYRERVGLQYNLFASTGEVREAYDEVRRRYGLESGLTGASCGDGSFEGEHRVDGRPVGRLLCFVDEPGHVAAIVWTREGLDVLSFAWRDDVDLAALYEAWRSGVGPDG